jgi:hypothetical protein
MVDVTLRITKIPSAADARRKRLPFAELENGEVVIRSRLSPDAPLNEHLVWLWGLLQNERRYLKSLQAQGAEIAVHARGVRGPVEVKPNGAEMLHILGVTLVIS